MCFSFTFFQVSRYFTEIFKKLCPQGHGVLVMKKGEIEGDVCPVFFFMIALLWIVLLVHINYHKGLVTWFKQNRMIIHICVIL